MGFRQIKYFFALLLLLLYGGRGTAQGWQRFYGDLRDDRAFALQLLPDGSLVAAGSTVPDSGALTDWYFLRTDAWGAQPSARHWGDPDWYEGANVLLPRPDGGWLLGGTRAKPNALGNTVSSIVLTFLDTDGQLEQSVVQPDMAYLTALYPAGEGYWYSGASYFFFPPDGTVPKPLFGLLDSAGQVVWQQNRFYGQYGEANDILPLPGNEALVAGWYQDAAQADVFLLNTGTGDSLLLSLPGQQRADKLLQAGADRFYLLGRTGVNSPDVDLLLVAFDNALDTFWTRTLPMPGNQQAHAALALPDGRIVLAGETTNGQTAGRDAFLAMFDSLGNTLWWHTCGGLKGDIFWDVQRAADGGFTLAGQTGSFSAGGDLQAWLVRTDSLGNLWSNSVAGRVVRDAQMDCYADPDEPALRQWLVTAAGAPGTVYALTDSLGQYAIPVDTGVWYVSVRPPLGYWTSCADSVAVAFDQFGQDTTVDFAVQAGYDCPLLYVDMATPYLRRCFDNTYTIRYFNYGPATASGASALVVLDPFLTVTGASLPYLQTGDTLRFELGDVPSLSGGNITLTAFLDCAGTVLGQVHCSSVHVLPDTLCAALNPLWDGSNLTVHGYCAGDSVVLTIANTGLDMSTSVEFVITEDQIIFKREPLQLAAGQDTTIVLHPAGATITLIVPQTPGHPGHSQPTLVIEGCGGPPASTGYGLQFPTDDGDPFTDIDCRANIGSFDPNDKTGLPEGVGTEHVIRSGTALEYLIRFQNTGTDTAFRVEIRDTLPAGSDLTTLEWGAAGHPYRPDVLGAGVLSIVFDPIALPDSAADFAGSQGFVKFRISTRPDLPEGHVLENRAAIYFDHNAPVLTGRTHHTIGEPLDWLLTGVDAPGGPAGPVGLTAAPNPFRTRTRLSWPDTGRGRPYRVECFDMHARRFCDRNTPTASVDFNAGDLPAGTYLVRVWQDERLVATGKLMTIR